MTLAALLTGGFAGTKDGAMVSGGAVETQTFVEENLSAIRDICHFLYIRQLRDLRRSTRKANSGVLNRRHDACGKFLPAGVSSVLLFVVLFVRAGLYLPDSSWSTIELPLKVSQGPSFPSLGRSGRDLHGSLAICLKSWRPLH